MKPTSPALIFSGVTSTELEVAASMAAAFGARLYLLHVVTHTATGVGFPTVPVVEPYPPALLREARDRLGERLVTGSGLSDADPKPRT